MGRIANSWSVFKQSLNVLKHDKELAILPIIAGIASLLIVATFVFPAQYTGLLERAAQENPVDENARYTAYALAFVVYLILSFITIYFQAALIGGAMQRLTGGDPTLGSSFRAANHRLGKIFVWSLFAATVNLLLHVLQSMARRGGNNFFARMIVGALGMGWTFLTYFVIPVLIFEEKKTFESLKRSGQLFKQRWGESLVGEYGIGFVIGIMTFLGMILLFGVGAYALTNGLVPLGVGFIVAGVLWILTMAIIGQALGGIYKAALYKYAKDGEVVPYFQPQSIQGAYHPTYTTANRL